MRSAWLSSATLLVFALGCASSDQRLSVVAPSPDELPGIPTRQDSYVQASISAERDSDTPRVVLVPAFKEPPLTPEEKEASGQLDPPYKLLPYPLARGVPGRGVGDWGGPSVAIGSVDQNITTGRAQRSIFAGAWGGPEIGVDPFLIRVRGLFPAARSAYAGPDEYPDVGIGDLRDHARAMRKRDN